MGDFMCDWEWAMWFLVIWHDTKSKDIETTNYNFCGLQNEFRSGLEPFWKHLSGPTKFLTTRQMPTVFGWPKRNVSCVWSTWDRTHHTRTPTSTVPVCNVLRPVSVSAANNAIRCATLPPFGTFPGRFCSARTSGVRPRRTSHCRRTNRRPGRNCRDCGGVG